ncbi:hypothetical protein CMK14_08755 [Candidatus Poribacteria bacterium]|nr:hypothetical protein [Candidatus Poribacteria bacterium]
MATATLFGPPGNRLPPTKMLRQLKHQVPLGSSTRTNLALGPNQCLARWWHARAEWEFKQPGETTLRIGAVRTLPCWMPYSSLPTLKLKIPVRLPTKKDREIQVKG